MSNVKTVAPKLLGREPAAWVGVIEAGLTLLLAFGVGVTEQSFGPIMAVVTALAGLYTAWATQHRVLGAIVGLAKAALVLGSVYGLNLTDHQTAAVIAAITVVGGFFNRTQTSPALDRPRAA